MRQDGRQLLQLPDARHEVGATAAGRRQQYHVIRTCGQVRGPSDWRAASATLADPMDVTVLARRLPDYAVLPNYAVLPDYAVLPGHAGLPRYAEGNRAKEQADDSSLASGFLRPVGSDV